METCGAMDPKEIVGNAAFDLEGERNAVDVEALDCCEGGGGGGGGIRPRTLSGREVDTWGSDGMEGSRRTRTGDVSAETGVEDRPVVAMGNGRVLGL